MIFVPFLERAHALPHQSVENDRMRLTGDLPGRIDSVDNRVYVVAVNALRIPTKGLPFAVHRLYRENLPRRPVSLLIIAVNKSEEMVETIVGSGHRRLPGRAFLKFPIRKKIEYPGGSSVQAYAQRHTHSLPETVTERASSHLESGRNFTTGHFKSRLICPIGIKLIDRDYAGLRQSRIQSDRVVSNRKE